MSGNYLLVQSGNNQVPLLVELFLRLASFWVVRLLAIELRQSLHINNLAQHRTGHRDQAPVRLFSACVG